MDGLLSVMVALSVRGCEKEVKRRRNGRLYIRTLIQLTEYFVTPWKHYTPARLPHYIGRGERCHCHVNAKLKAHRQNFHCPFQTNSPINLLFLLQTVQLLYLTSYLH